MHSFNHRLATFNDQERIVELMRLSIAENMKAFLSDKQIEAAKESMGLDKTLLQDKTYFVIETQVEDTTNNKKSLLIGCGGWGKRKTLFGGDHTQGRDDTLSDPTVDPARIRAMYTHPDFVRCGVGGLLIQLGEDAAREAGFKTIELGSTIPGEPFYLQKGYLEVSRITHKAANGSTDTIIKMRKSL